MFSRNIVLLTVLLPALAVSLAFGHATSTASAVDTPVSADIVALYNQPPRPEGGILLSSLRDPDGSAADQWVWDAFSFPFNQTISEIKWRGAYDPARLGSGGRVVDFSVAIYSSNATGAQPDISRPPLAHYEVGGNAGEVAAAILGGVQTYDYGFVLDAPFQAAAHTKYWVQIEGYQAGSPDWGLSAATGGDGSYFRRIPGQGGNYQLIAGDAAFALFGPQPESPPVYIPVLFSP